MDEIKAPQTGKQLDADLRSILTVLEEAPDHEGQVLYIRHGQIDYMDGDDFFTLTPLT